MHPEDRKFVYQGISVIYKHRRSLQDRRHLLVIFSGGFGPKRGYDMSGSVVDGIRTDILWIRDIFDGDFSYYIRTHKRGTLVAEAVAALIEKIRLERGLEKRHCTFMGISKGATGALYHALAYDYPNVIAVSPRIRIGSGNRLLRPKILKQLIGQDTDAGVEELDGILPGLLANDSNTARNIYLFSSPNDGQYQTEIVPFLKDYERYDNFNFVLTESPLVARHRDVGSYNIPLLLATIAALGEGAAPRYGHVRNGTDAFETTLPLPSIETVRARQETIARFTSLQLRNDRFYPEGLLFIKGQSTRGAGKISRKLVFSSGILRRKYALRSATDEKLSRTFFENEFCDYSRGKFSTVDGEGIDLTKLAPGQYSVGLEVKHDGISASVDAVPAEPFDGSLAIGKHLVRVSSTGNTVEMHKGSILVGRAPGSHFKLAKGWAKGSLAHVEGQYVLPGIRTPQRGTMSYYLVLVHASTHTPVASHPLATQQKAFEGTAVGDPLGSYAFTYFNTVSGEGVHLEGTAPGEYDLYVTAVAGSIASSHATGLRLTVTGSEAGVECSLRSKMPVPGGRVAASWALNNRSRVARVFRRDLGRVKRRLLAARR